MAITVLYFDTRLVCYPFERVKTCLNFKVVIYSWMKCF